MKEKDEVALRLGLSTCLLGEEVRYDGGHKLDRFLAQTLAPYVEWVPVCPEVEAGLSTPREAMRLVGDAAAPGHHQDRRRPHRPDAGLGRRTTGPARRDRLARVRVQEGLTTTNPSIPCLWRKLIFVSHTPGTES